METHKIITPNTCYVKEVMPVVDAIINGSIFDYVMNLSFKNFGWVEMSIYSTDCSSLISNNFNYKIIRNGFNKYIYMKFGPLMVCCYSGTSASTSYRFIMDDKTIDYIDHYNDCETDCLCDKIIGEQFSFKATKNARKIK